MNDVVLVLVGLFLLSALLDWWYGQHVCPYCGERPHRDDCPGRGSGWME